MSVPRAWWKLALAGLFIVALAAAWRFTPLYDYLTGERVRDWARLVRETPWAPVALILAYTPAAFLMFPRPLLTLVAVIAFGRWIGFACAMAGILLSAFAAFYAGRLLPPSTMRRYGGRYYEPAKRALERHGLVAVFESRRSGRSSATASWRYSSCASCRPRRTPWRARSRARCA